MLIVGILLTGFSMFLVGGIQGVFRTLVEQTFGSLRATWLQRERQSYALIFLSVGKWWILRLLFTFVLACSWVFYLVLLSLWVRYHRHTSRSWYVPNVLTHSDSKAWHSIYVATALSESPWRVVSLATVSPQVPPIFVVIIVFSASGIQLGIYHCSRFAVPPGFNTIAWKSYFIFGSFNFASFLQIYFMFPETVKKKKVGHC